MRLVYKVCRPGEWDEAKAAGCYAGSVKDRADGFLHFSAAGQLPGTLEKHYAGVDELVLVAVDADALGEALKYEPSRGGALFPHLYGPLPLSAVRWEKAIRRERSGIFGLPGELGP
jgi:uncharacterized protein (DUF952 family)